MKKLTAALVVLFCSSIASAEIKKVSFEQLPWTKTLKQTGVEAINVCGNNQIQVSRSSLKKHFLVGKPRQGFFLSGLIAHEDYWKILKTMNKEEATASLRKIFENTQLWRVAESGEIKSLGNPQNVEFPFTATVKVCVEGAKTSLGMDCSRLEVKSREGCCSEKFLGPIAFWDTGSGKAELIYSPDPSVSLRVPHEKKHRYCQVVDSIAVP